MKEIIVKVQEDHLHRITAVNRPIHAVNELIWNALDADSTRVDVILDRDPLGNVSQIRVQDNGTGMPYAEVVEAFEKLGGSWKRDADRTRNAKRLLHGRAGKGRFRAFALGADVYWRTRVQGEVGLRSFEISGSSEQLGRFRISDPEPAQGSSGTDVTIASVHKQFRSLEGTAAIQAVAEELAIYLRKYADVTVSYEGVRIDPSVVEDVTKEYHLAPILADSGEEISATLLVVEWSIPVERSLFLCDAAGFALHRVQPGIQARGFNFTAYLRSDFIRRLDDDNLLTLDDLNPDLLPLVDAAKDCLRTHFRNRAAASATAIVEEWKRDAIYPFEGDPASVIEEAERQVFDVVALNVFEFLPSFAEADVQSKRFSMRLIRQALEEGPEALRTILIDVLSLPLEKRDQLAKLLERTSLTAIINAAKMVSDRLNFLRGLEALVYDPDLKKVLKERSQLHRILEPHTWIFGEHFNLTVSDQSLTAVLAKHLAILRRDDETGGPVLRSDGSVGIVDLMLSRAVPHPRADEREHLIVELKRPSKKIDHDVVQQIQEYAFAVSDDERFRDSKTRWSFWAVSSEIEDTVRRRLARQRDRPGGLVYDDADGRVQVWVKCWGHIVEECQARLRFFADNLQYTPDDQTALEYLRELHSEYLPPEYAERVQTRR